MEGPERRLRALAESESRRPAVPSSSLDPRSDALVRIAALVAVNAAAPSYLCVVRDAMTVGVTIDEVIDTLIAVSATVGLARVVSATPGMANALGIDIDAALEQILIETPPHGLEP
jgi:alkylhydroperoxidase/carboxymuconolactone decarboxylase family protein YurZ